MTEILKGTEEEMPVMYAAHLFQLQLINWLKKLYRLAYSLDAREAEFIINLVMHLASLRDRIIILW